jgi:hypothetical protein
MAATSCGSSIYEPPYLFKGPRPTMTLVPAQASYGQQISFLVQSASTIRWAQLMRPMSVTHQMDSNMRLVDLPITVSSGVATVSLPANRNLLPPGPYMLNITDSAGVPSESAWVMMTDERPGDICGPCCWSWIAGLALWALTVGGAVAARVWAGLSGHEQRSRPKVRMPRDAPKPGRDPAAQHQTGLAAAARAPRGNGTRGVRPARAVKGRRLRRPARLGDPRRTGVLSSGCVLGYGATGSQCVPAHRPGGAPMTCEYLSR